MENHLKEALMYARLEKLPKACNGAWEGDAIVLIERIGGQQTYAIGTWNEKAKRANIAMDFDHRMEQSFIEAYPIPDLEKKRQAEKEAALKEQYRKEFEAEKAVEDELKALGSEDVEGTLEEKKAKILSIKAASGNVELAEMKDFLLEMGYDATWCGRLTLESATASVEKIKGIQAEIVALDEEPLTNKDDIVEQLKALKKKNK